MKIGLITSKGGHLFQVYQLKDWWVNYDRFWLTDKGGDSDFLLKGEKVYYGYFPESRHLINAIRNFFLGWKIIRKEKPDLLFSCGAGIAPPVFLAAKIFSCKLIFMEPYDFIQFSSLSGRLLESLVDKLLVQQVCQKKFFKKAEFWGSTL